MDTYSNLVNALLGELSVTLHAINPDEFNALKQTVLQARRVFVAGKGRSGQQMRGFAMRLMHLGLRVHVVDDVTTPAITAGDLLVIGSGSGRTPSMVTYAQLAKQLNATVAVLTIDADSPVAKSADLIVKVPAITPKLDNVNMVSNQPMGSLFEQALHLVLDLIITQLMDDLHMTSEQMFTLHANLE